MIDKNLQNRIKEIALSLAEILSVSETPGEVEVSEKVYEIFSEMDYFKENPEDLEYVHVPNDALGRKSVIATLRGKKDNNKDTVVMIGHTDSVGISDYGNLRHLANNPIELTKKFEEIKETLAPEVQKDIESGDYLFGRGLFDMKIGDAIIMGIMEDISKDLENFSGNLIFAAVCDEEVNSKGMLTVVPRLVEMRNENDFNYLAMLDTDYMTAEYPGDEDKYVYIGAVGKLMPSFFIVGSESHVGESFSGLDPNQIVAEITRRINLNTEFSDIVDGEVTLPPITLKQRDLKPEYTVQIAKTANVFFNYATHCSTPDEVMEKMIGAAEDAFDETIEILNSRYEKYCELAKQDYERLPWETKVISYDELYELVKKEMGDELDELLEKQEAEYLEDSSIDEREHSLKMVEYLHSLWSNVDPVIVVYFTPPYYPHIYVSGETENERRLLDAAQKAVDETESDYNIVAKKFFPAIADISYAAAPKDPQIMAALQDNMPGWGKKYSLPIEAMQDLNLPVFDIGAFGKDAHQFTERIKLDYSLNEAPELVYRTIFNLLELPIK